MQLFILVFEFAVLILLIGLTHRTLMVADYRRKIIWKIIELSVNEGVHGNKMSLSKARWSAYRKVSFDKMLYQAWKPLSEFYKGRDFNIKGKEK